MDDEMRLLVERLKAWAKDRRSLDEVIGDTPHANTILLEEAAAALRARAAAPRSDANATGGE